MVYSSNRSVINGAATHLRAQLLKVSQIKYCVLRKTMLKLDLKHIHQILLY